MKAFIDSNYFIALVNPKDSLHEKAKQLSKNFFSSDLELFTSSFVFLEAVTVISQRVGKVNANKFGKDLLDNERIKIVAIEKMLHKRSWEIFQEVSQKNVSFVDCSIIATMKLEDIATLITFDKEDFIPLKRKYKFALY